MSDKKRKHNDFPELGPIGGTVQKIGWNKNYIVVYRDSHSGSSSDGWMIIEVKSKKVTGPFSDKNDIPIKNIIIFPASEAWKRLDR